MKNILNKIRIDNTLYLLILVALLSGYIKRTFIILLIVLVHELGHVFFFVLFNVEIESVVIYPFGGVTKVNKRIHERIYRDVLIGVGGILFQLVLYVIFALLFVNGFIVKSTFEMFKTSNLSIILFNLLPIIPLDGSKLLFSLCTKFFSFKRSLLLQKVIGSFFLICFVFYTFNNGLGDVITACFLFVQLFSLFKENKYILNKFYLERVLYDNYYNGIYSNKCVSDMRIDKYYYFPEGKRYVSEKNYLKKNKF